MIKPLFTFKNLLWLVYVAILIVIAPHTQWMFASIEPSNREWVSWVAAIGFESTIFVVTHLLVRHIERRKAGTFNFDKQRLELGKLSRHFSWWPKFRYRWLNTYTLLLLIACAISAGANLSHAVEFAQPLKIVTDWGVPASVITIAFGGILPLVNLLFAAVIANVDDAEQAADPALEQAKAEKREAEKRARAAEQAQREAENSLKNAERQLYDSEQRYKAVGDLIRYVFEKDVPLRERIRGLRAQRPDLSQNRIAGLIGCSVSVVNEVWHEEPAINMQEAR